MLRPRTLDASDPGVDTCILSNMAANPLTEPCDEIPFDAIEAAHVIPAIEAGIELAQTRVRALISESAPPSWDNCMAPLETCGLELEWAAGIAGHLDLSLIHI